MPAWPILTPKHRSDAIISAAAKHYLVTVDAVMGRSRLGPVVKARQVAMYLLRETGDYSLPAIGRRMGRDHTTVLHGVRAVAASPALMEAAAYVAAAAQDALAGEEGADG
jgi:chromosomal replication initiation ATPase DnaA